MNNEVKSPPTTIPSIVRNIGPGLILAGSIVGSGELIATTKTGAEAHFDFLWLIILGCIVKVFAQVELGRYVITHNKTSLSALNSLPGPRLKLATKGGKFEANWILLFWSVMLLTFLAQQGGIAGGVGQAMAITFPLSEEGSQIRGFEIDLVHVEVLRVQHSFDNLWMPLLINTRPLARTDVSVEGVKRILPVHFDTIFSRWRKHL